MVYSGERLGRWTWKIVENDRFGQYPFIYVRLADDKCIVIDTGCGTGDLRAYIDKYINTGRLPYYVICTHVHFDHVGGAFMWSGERSEGTKALAMGDANVRYTENSALTSLCASHNHTLKEFHVTKWLKDGDVVYLNDSTPSAARSLRVLHTPGHTLDSISVYDVEDNRLFVGDLIYPFTGVGLASLGHSLKQYRESLRRLVAFARDPAAAVEALAAAAAAATAAPSGASTGGAGSKADEGGEASKGEGGEASKADGAADGGEASKAAETAEGGGPSKVDGTVEGDISAASGQEGTATSASSAVASDGTGSGAGAGGGAGAGAGATAATTSPAAVDDSGAAATASATAATPAPAPAPAAAAPADSMQEKINHLCLALDLTLEEVEMMFDPKTLLFLNNGDVYAAMMMVQAGLAAEMAPPVPLSRRRAAQAAARAAKEAEKALGTEPEHNSKTFEGVERPSQVRLSGGHVEANMTPHHLQQMLDMLASIQAGELPPHAMVDEGAAEYSNGMLSVVLEVPAKWES